MDNRRNATTDILHLLEGASVIVRKRPNSWSVHPEGVTLLVDLASRLVSQDRRSAFLASANAADLLRPIVTPLYDTAIAAARCAYVLATDIEEAPESVDHVWTEWGLQALTTAVLALGVLKVADKIREEGPEMTGILLAAVLGQGHPTGWPALASSAAPTPFPRLDGP